MLRRKISTVVVLASVLMSSSLVRAQEETDSPDDARVMGYAKPIAVKDPGATASSWAIWSILGILCIGVLFKSGKRTHLD